MENIFFSEKGKVFRYIIKDNLINYFEPNFENIERNNPHIKKTPK